VITEDHPKTFREVGIMLTQIREDIHEIKTGQQKVVWWVAGMVSSFIVGGVISLLFQK
jgi:hypothetical protein